jgi:hypothetical protein
MTSPLNSAFGLLAGMTASIWSFLTTTSRPLREEGITQATRSTDGMPVLAHKESLTMRESWYGYSPPSFVFTKA